MNHKFIPQTTFIAWNYFRTIPSYSFFDFLQKKAVVFKEGEILSAVKYTKYSLVYLIYFKTDKHDGYFFHSGKLDEKVFGNVEVKVKNEYADRNVVNEHSKVFFSIYSPPLWVLILTALVSYFCINGYVFPGYSNPQAYVNAYCSAECIKGAAMAWNVIALLAGIVFGIFAIGFVFFFFVSPKTRNAQKFNYMRSTSFMFMIMSTFIGNMVYQKMYSEKKFNQLVVILRLAYTPEYFKEANNRKIASEIMGGEIKEKK